MNGADLDLLATLARNGSGQVLRGDRTFFAEGRLAPLARRLGLASVDALLGEFRAKAEPATAKAIVEALLVGETWFYRDAHVFRDLARDVLPPLAARRSGQALRFWSAGCGAGQEAYSLAMMLADAAVGDARPQVLATDLSERALEKAHSGVYTPFEVQRGLPIRSLLRWFEKTDESWRAQPHLRQSIRWGRLNLLDDFTRLGRADVILCRNVLSSMTAESRFSVLERLGAALADDGVLVLGVGETVELAGFDPLRPGGVIFHKNPAYARAAA